MQIHTVNWLAPVRLLGWLAFLVVCVAPGIQGQSPDSVLVDSVPLWNITTRTFFTRVPPPIHDTVCPPLTALTLKQLGTARRLTMATMATVAMMTDPLYKAKIVEQFQGVMPGNELKWGATQPTATTWAFKNADSIVNFATANGLILHGHTLLWPYGTSAWVTNGGYTKSQLLAIEKKHIDSLLTRYKGKIATWDVVNEATTSTGGYELGGNWLRVIGPEYIDSAFVWAHRADPAAKLFLNDYGAEGPGVKADSILALAVRLKSRGVPIDGVGFQSHMPKGDNTTPSAASVEANLARFVSAGLDIRISEMDVRVADNLPASTAYVTQAITYRDMLDACLSLTRCVGVTLWGLTDRYSSQPLSHPGYGRALPFDSAYHAKPAYDSLVARLRRVP